MTIFYYKNYFSNIKSKEARLRGALVSYEGLTNSIRPLSVQSIICTTTLAASVQKLDTSAARR